METKGGREKCLLIREDHIKNMYLFSALLLFKLFGLIVIFSCVVWPYGVKYSAFWFLFIPPSGFDLPTLLQLIHKKTLCFHEKPIHKSQKQSKAKQ